MSGAIMELEDYYQQARAEIGAQREQIDNLVAMVSARDKRIAEQDEQIKRLTLALDEALGIARARRAEAEALEL